jgi:hypothetical protein
MSRRNSPGRVHRTPKDHYPTPHPVAGNQSPAAAIVGAIFPLPGPAVLTTHPTPGTQPAAA